MNTNGFSFFFAFSFLLYGNSIPYVASETDFSFAKDLVEDEVFILSYYGFDIKFSYQNNKCKNFISVIRIFHVKFAILLANTSKSNYNQWQQMESSYYNVHNEGSTCMRLLSIYIGQTILIFVYHYLIILGI